MNKIDYRNLLQLVLSLSPRCWGCGGEPSKAHHIIPKGNIPKPHMNMTIPMCDECEKKVHVNDHLIYLVRKVLTGELYFINKKEVEAQ